MKACPQCGYQQTKTHRELLALYRKHFGEIPIWDMIHRGWINAPEDVTDSQTGTIVAVIRQELMRFFMLDSEVELDGFIAGEFDPLTKWFRRPRICNTEPERIVV